MDTLELPRQVNAKIKRAANLINELDELLRYWGEECFIHTLHHNEEKTHYQLELTLKMEPPIDECEAVLGDLMHNMRAALDLWMSHQANATGADDKKLRLQFPIYSTGDDFRKWRTKYKDRLDAHLVEEIRRHLPIGTQTGPRNWLLALSDLDNADKHRIISSIDFGYIANLDATVSPVPPSQGPPRIEYKPYLVSARSGGLVLDLYSEVPIDMEAPQVHMAAFFELDGTKHELVQNVRGLHFSVQRLLMTIQHNAAAQRSKAEQSDGGNQPGAES